MSKPYFCAVIGKGFGDEGKGLAVDFLSSRHDKVLVIRHNGGAQSGHTVEWPDKRFVFHELSSGSFRHADTFWAGTYFPDLYKLGEEISAFCDVSGFVPDIYADKNASVTIIDDVLLNMAAEEARGDGRHGSCGMGIYEAQCRRDAGWAITVGELLGWKVEELVHKLQKIRKHYLPARLEALGLQDRDLGEYGEMLRSDAVLANLAEQMLANLKYIKPVDDVHALVADYDCAIFENGQGLLLDSENEAYSPHVTASKTGLINPCKILQRLGMGLDEVVYVTRSYVTRHGAGPLPNECTRADLGIEEEDKTNVENAWQGSLRYARHESLQEFARYIKADLQNLNRYNLSLPVRTLMITHLNETGNAILSQDGNYSVEVFCRQPDISNIFDRFFLSASHFGKDVSVYECG